MNPISQQPPRVSVVVPNYNYERFLPDRLASIVAQTFTDYELILLDDASTDGSVQVLRDFAQNHRVQTLSVNTENSGTPFRQWAKGIGMATGDYVWIAEADDCADSHFLERIMACIDQVHDVSFAFAGSYLMDDAGQVEPRDPNHWGRRVRNKFGAFDGHDYVLHNLYWKNYVINASGVVFSRVKAQRLLSSPAFDMRFCGDWLFWCQMALQGNVIELYERLNYFRQHARKQTEASHRSGGGPAEDIDVAVYLNATVPGIRPAMRRLQAARLYRKVRRIVHDSPTRRDLTQRLREELRFRSSDLAFYFANHLLHPLIPSFMTVRSQRL